MNPVHTVFYTLEETIKSYRRFAHRRIKQKLEMLTLDQGLILMILDSLPNTNQVQLGEILFKDNASVTRTIKRMTEIGYLNKTVDRNDKRTASLSITRLGRITLKKLVPIVETNRKTALTGITEQEMQVLLQVLGKISRNVNKEHDDQTI